MKETRNKNFIDIFLKAGLGLFAFFIFFYARPAAAAVGWITPIEVTPSTAATWVDVDVSSYVSSNATGVMLHFVNNSNVVDRTVGYRKNGSTDTLTGDVKTLSHMWAAIGVDSNKILEIYVADTTDVDVYLVGYFENDAVFFTNSVDKSLAVASVWTDIDISTDTGTDTALAAILTVEGSGSYRWYGLRKNGSTDDYQGPAADVFEINSAIIGVDANEIFEGIIENTDVDFHLVGYIVSDVTMNTNATDLSLSTTDAWLDLNTLPSGATGAFIEVWNGAYGWGLRKNGSTENIYRLNRHAWGFIEADTSQIVEGYISNTVEDFFLTGYTTAAAPSNSAPTITSVTDSPDPVPADADIYWNVDWSDADTDEMIKVFVCKTNAITTSTPACTGGAWAISPVFTNRDPEGLAHYTTSVSDIGTQNYYVFVCDDSGDSTTACSNSTSGIFTVEERSPSAPSVLLLENMPNPVNIATTSPRFSAVYNDPNINDTANKYCIQVNTASDFSGTDMWVSDGTSCNTGNSMSNCSQGNRCQDIYYNGTSLSLDNTVYYWRMWYWDDSGNKSATSTTANFTMANGAADVPRGVRLKGGRLKGGVRLK